MITAVVLWIVALIFIIVTLKNIIVRAIKIKRCTATTEGVISDVEEKVSTRHGIKSRTYIPTVNYTVDGTEYSKRFAKAYNADTYTVGRTLELFYDPNDPSKINKMWTNNKADIVMLCIGIFIGAAGAVMLAIQ
jgi:hypothetical protein